MSRETPLAAGTPAATPAGYDAWLQQLASEPWRLDFYQALRHIESAHPHLPRLGEAMRPADEPIRVAQPAEMTFAPAPISGLVTARNGTPRLMQRIFGLVGPNGALPVHLTEHTRERALQHADPATQRFLDTLTHRFALLFYRAWAQAQPVISLDRPGDTRYARWLGALFGIGEASLLSRDALGDAAKLNFTGRLARQVRDADGLLAWCRSVFDVPVQVDQWCGHWMPLARDERTRMRHRRTLRDTDGAGQGLGRGAVLGKTVWDVQHKFRITIGPLPLAHYQAFLPGGADLARLQALVRQWVGLEFAWDLRLILRKAEVPALRMGAGAPHRNQLGRTAWLGHYRKAADADDLVIDVERLLRRRPAHAASEPLPEPV
ncbi:MAG TPA: type VI secretion system baseplate subunit TssG [Ideonella sp.]|nr:type VI secretion system baseplate subunit TssG [Ideonella sp.]